jgi:MobA/MobL family
LAIFHLSVHDRVSRGAGQSSLASAAYIDRAKHVDERTAAVFDYTRLHAPLFTGMYTPKDAPDWARNAAQLWNRVEAFEKRRDAQLAMPIDIALPHELTLEQNRYLLQDFVRENFVRKGYVAQVAIHSPDHDHRNIHAHVLVTLRKIDEHGFARTKGEQQENYRNRGEYTEGLRESWEKLANRHLERHGHDARIDRRSLSEQGVDRAPTTHLGPTAAAAIFQHADRSELQMAEAELKAVTAEIVDLAAARATRDARKAQEERREDVSRRAEPELGKTAGDIRLAWSLTQTGQEFAAALEEGGLMLARVSAEEARQSERTQAFAEEVGRHARRFAGGELVAVDLYGDAYPIDERSTGNPRGEIDKRLGSLDAAGLPSMTEAGAAMREASRAAWIAEKDREQPLTAMEERVAAAWLATQQVAADMLERFGRPLSGGEFADGLAQVGIRLARVTAEDIKQIEIDRAVAFAVGDTQFVPRVREGEVVAIDRAGGIHLLNPHRLDLAGIEQMLGRETLPGVAETQEAATERGERQERGQAPSEGYEQKAAPMGAASEPEMRGPADIAGRLADGALKLLGGVFEFLFPTKREPAPKLDPEEEYRQWVEAEEAKRAREELLHGRPPRDRDEIDPGGPDEIEETETLIDGQTRHVRSSRGRRRTR